MARQSESRSPKAQSEALVDLLTTVAGRRQVEETLVQTDEGMFT
jgi:hypothetical protein